jgi:hypothetical protein
MWSERLAVLAMGATIAACGGNGPPGGNSVALTFFRGSAPASPDWIAYQDGDGPWQLLPGTGGLYQFTVPSGKYGIAAACIGTSKTEILQLQATTAELGQPSMGCSSASFPPPGGFRVSVQVNGISPDESTLLAMGGHEVFSTRGPYDISDVIAGTYDLVVAKGIGGQGSPFSPTSFVLQRDLRVTGDAMVGVDFAAQGVAPAPRTLTVVGGAAGEQLGAKAALLAARGTGFPLADTSGASLTYPSMPPSALRPGDLHALVAEAEDRTVNGSRSSTRLVSTPGDVAITLPPALASAAVSKEAVSPYVRLRTDFGPYAGAQIYYLGYSYYPTSAARIKNWSVLFTAGWLGSSASYTLPDLSAQSGWQAEWGHQPGTSIEWSVGATSTNRSLSDLFTWVASQIYGITKVNVDGLEVHTATRRGSFTP